MMMSVQHAETNNSHARLSSSRASAGASNYNKMKNRFERRSYSLAPSIKSMVVKSARRTNHKRNRATSRWSENKQHPRSYTLADRRRQQRQQSMMVAPPTSYGVSDQHGALHHEPRFNSRSGTIYSPQNDFHSGNPHLENQHYRERRCPLAASAQRHQITGARNKNSNAFTRASTMDNSYSFGPPVASQHRKIVVPPLSSTPRSIGSSAKATAPSATQRLPPPTSFVNLLQRTLETSVDKIKQTNAGYRAPSSPRSVVGSTISAPSSSDVQDVKKDGRKKEEQETNSTNTTNATSTGRLAYDPSQPQYSPTYDPDPFYNDNEYSSLFPSWYD